MSKILNLIIGLLFVIIFGTNEKDNLFEVRIGELGFNHLKVILSESPQLKDLVKLLFQKHKLLRIMNKILFA